ncbi:MAG: 3-deoxy-D-manno-octulosonic acid transferase, partial [Burkholderiales bacterium]|nr:3-deoxy-D-manno-octulosonic acid transferase [Burkholderiales bacterium]
MLMRTAYRLVWWLALPWLPLRLWWRGRREPGYRTHVGERFGRYASPPPTAGELVWIHAVSLGETRAAAPLVAKLLREFPSATILLTHMTATGREAGAAYAGERVLQAWLPYDIPFAVRRFLAHWKPRTGLLMETEVWPNLTAQCAAAGIALYLVNARLSERSLAGYRRAASLTRPMFASLAGVAAQSAADAARLREAGARDVAITGNLKFDGVAPDAMQVRGRELRARFGRQRPVWLAASTREGEEALLADALARARLPEGMLTVIVPRHPQRFDEVARLLADRGIAFARRSADAFVAPDIAVVLGDTLGELPAYYAAADAAFIGGSLV